MSSLLRRLREEPGEEDREKPAPRTAAELFSMSMLTAADAEALISAKPVAHLTQKLYRMNIEFCVGEDKWRLNVYRDGATGAYFAPVESCGRLIKYELQRLEPELDFIIKTKRFADGENRVIVNSNWREEPTEAMQEICDRYCGMPINRKSGVVTIKPPIGYQGAPCYFMCSAVEWHHIK